MENCATDSLDNRIPMYVGLEKVTRETHWLVNWPLWYDWLILSEIASNTNMRAKVLSRGKMRPDLF